MFVCSVWELYKLNFFGFIFFEWKFMFFLRCYKVRLCYEKISKGEMYGILYV